MTHAKLNVIAHRRSLLDWFDPIRLELIRSTRRPGLVPPVVAAAAAADQPTRWPVATDKPDRKKM